MLQVRAVLVAVWVLVLMLGFLGCGLSQKARLSLMHGDLVVGVAESALLEVGYHRIQSISHGCDFKHRMREQNALSNSNCLLLSGVLSLC
jgi:hypothetical protein